MDPLQSRLTPHEPLHCPFVKTFFDRCDSLYPKISWQFPQVTSISHLRPGALASFSSVGSSLPASTARGSVNQFAPIFPACHGGAHGPLASFGIAETANILHPMNHKPYILKFAGSKACLSALDDFIICWEFPVSTSRSVAGCLLGARPWRRSWENSSSCRPAQWRKQNHKQTW